MSNHIRLPSGKAVRDFLRLVSREEVIGAVCPSTGGSGRKPTRYSDGLTRVSAGLLDGAGTFKTDIRKLHAHHRRVERHPVYTWLMQNAHFKDAVGAFNAFALRRARVVDSRFASRFAEYRFSQYKFLDLIIPSVYLFLLRERHRAHPEPVARGVLIKALKHVRGLQKSIKAGARLEAPLDQERLTQLLDDLAFRCEFWMAPRRLPRNDPTWPKREFIARTARTLYQSFGKGIPDRVYAALTAGIDYYIEPKELRHQLAVARSQ
jgi:hypothetical protein